MQNKCKHLFPSQNAVLAIAGDDDIVRLHDTTKEKLVCEFKAHETRQVFFSFFLFSQTDTTSHLCRTGLRCVNNVLGLQSKSGGQFHDGRLLCDGDGFERWLHQNVEAPFKRGTPDAVFTPRDFRVGDAPGHSRCATLDCDRESWVFTLQKRSD